MKKEETLIRDPKSLFYVKSFPNMKFGSPEYPSRELLEYTVYKTYKHIRLDELRAFLKKSEPRVMVLLRQDEGEALKVLEFQYEEPIDEWVTTFDKVYEIQQKGERYGK